MDKNKSLKERIASASTKQWMKFGIWGLIFLLFVLWLGNFGWLLLFPFIFDTFITKYIPWSWWKESKNKTVRTVMSWVDAIVFALVAVYLINSFVFQNYQIPTSSLEKTLLVGDFLAVSKVSYGPRVPMTPFSFPLVQNTFPVFNSKSYLEKPQIEYRRLKGLDTIKRNDIVVFNFPPSDTIAFKVQNPDYYTSCYREGAAYMINVLNKKPERDSCFMLGKKIVASKPQQYGEIMWRPVDRRENFVKRCIAIPGDSLKIINNQVYVNGKAQAKLEGIQFNYFVQTDGTRFTRTTQDNLGISNDDFAELDNNNYYKLIQQLGLNPNFPVYHFPLTAEAYEKLKKTRGVTNIVIEPDWVFVYQDRNADVFPLGSDLGWSRDNYGSIYIPRKGATVELNHQTYQIYSHAIRHYEHVDLTKKDDKYFIDNKEVRSYTFKMNYYWMMGDNRHNSSDSRYWGFVPEDHIVGSPMFVWLSLNKDKGWLDGRVRWKRFFKSAKQ